MKMRADFDWNAFRFYQLNMTHKMKYTFNDAIQLSFDTRLNRYTHTQLAIIPRARIYVIFAWLNMRRNRQFIRRSSISISINRNATFMWSNPFAFRCLYKTTLKSTFNECFMRSKWDYIIHQLLSNKWAISVKFSLK